MQHLPAHVASKIFTSINLNFTCQSQPQADRRLCYQLMQVMMKNKPAGELSVQLNQISTKHLKMEQNIRLIN